MICSTGPTSSSLISTGCGQTFVANEFMNWGLPTSSGGLGQALDPPPNLGQSAIATASNGSGQLTSEQIAIDSKNMTLERFDNTTYAWDAALNEWVSPTFLEFGSSPSESVNTFAGQFDAPDLETSSAPYGPGNLQNPFGDNLLGAVPNAGSNAEMMLTFSQPLYGLAFEVSSATNLNFIATLDAYNSSGGLIGVYQVNGTGVGGICAGLNNSAGPVPCNDAPVIEFYDPQGRIASVVLTVNDTSGLFIDSMSLTSLASGGLTGAPESNTAPLIGIGLIVLALAAKRTSHWRAPRKSVSESEG